VNDSVDLIRNGTARILDLGCATVLVWYGWQLAFGPTQPFEIEAGWIGFVGGLACLLDPRAARRFPVALLGFVLATVASSMYHNWDATTREGVFEWRLVFEPISHLLYMLVFVFGAAYVLRSPARQAGYVLFTATVALVLAIQIMFDRAATGFVYTRADPTFMPSVQQWAGIHQLSVPFVIGLPMCLSVAVVRPTALRVFAGGTLTGVMLLAGWVTGSRTGLAVMMATTMLMIGGAALRRYLSRRLGIAVLATGIAALSALFVLTPAAQLSTISGDRLPLWQSAWHMFLDHPWIGIGPQKFPGAMFFEYGQRYVPSWGEHTTGFEHAHNLPLQVAAETGIVGVLCLLAFIVWGCWACVRLAGRGYQPVLVFAIGFAFFGFFARVMFDNFFALELSHDRLKPFAWLTLGGVVALSRHHVDRE
jgi:hypothetical protein